MALSSVNTQASASVAGQTVNIPAPQSGQNVAVQSSPGGTLVLEFDPSEAASSRDGNNLVFEVDGARVEITDFFAVGESTLPTLSLPGDVEIAAEDFLAAINPDMDLTTAAGSAGSSAGGGTSYDDNAGDLLDGVSKLGDQQTFHWDRETQPDEEMIDGHRPVQPGGTITFGTNTYDDGGVLLLGGVYEDGRPGQGTGDNSINPGVINLNITPNEGTTILNNAITLTIHDGLEGKVYLSDPNGDPAPEPIERNADGSFTLTTEQAAQSLYYVPGNNDSDADIPVTIDLVFVAEGGQLVVHQPATIYVDAVADFTEADATATTDEITASLADGSTSEADGWIKTEQALDDATSTAKVTVTVEATFGDYMDDSEAHYLLVESITDSNGNPVTFDVTNLPDGYSYVGTIEQEVGGETVTFHQIAVDNSVIADGGGHVSLDLVHDFPQVDGDTTFPIRVGSMAEEQNISGGELNLDNNLVININDTAVDAVVNVVNSTLEVKVGWASEGGIDSQHDIDGEHVSPTNAGSTDDGSAPIHISLGDAPVAGEFITNATLTFPDGAGELSWTDVSGITVTDNGDGSYTISVAEGMNLTSLDSLGLTFTPSDANADADINLGVKVTVQNDAGAVVEFSGNTVVAVDAVADLSGEVETTVAAVEQGEGFATAETETKESGWETDTITVSQNDTYTTTVSVSTTFTDVTDGSENQYMLVKTPAAGEWSLDGIGADGTGTITVDGQTISYETQNIGGTDYYVFNVTGLATTEGGEVSIDLPVTIGQGVAGEDSTITFLTGSMTKELDHDGRELDTSNDTSFRLDETPSTITVDRIGGGLTVKTGWASESGNDAKHLESGDPADYAVNQAGIDSASTADGGAPIQIGIAGGNGEFITEVTLSFPEGAGELSWDNANGITVTPNGDGSYTITFDHGMTPTDLNDLNLTYTPDSNSTSDADIGFTYEVKVENGAGNTATYSGDSTVAVDAVADIADDVTATLGDGSELIHTVEEGDIKTTQNENDTDARDATGTETDSFSQTYADGEYGFPVTVTTTFADTDGSESHFILIEKPEGNWSLDVPDGMTFTVEDINGTTYFKVDVTEATTDNSGEITLEATLTVSGVTGDVSATTVKTGTMTEETTTAGAEHDTANNQAVYIDEAPLTVGVDLINGSLTVTTGWTSEGNDENQHLPAGSADHDATAELEKGTTEDVGAPITFNLAGGDNSGEFIQSIAVNAGGDGATPGDLGYLNADGNWTALAEGSAVINGTTYNVTEGPDGFVLTVAEGADPSTSLNLYFKPDAGSSLDTDVPVTYTVTVANEAGSTATYNGTSTVVIDAVADLADDVTSGLGDDGTAGSLVHSVDDGDITIKQTVTDGSAARNAAGQEVDTFKQTYQNGEYDFPVSVTTTFADTDGSESHFILIEKPGANWSLDDLPAGTTVTEQTIDGTTYFKVDVTNATTGNTGEITLNATLTATGIKADLTDTVKTGTMTVENVEGTAELDTTNNEAVFIHETPLNVGVDLINGTLTVKTGWASEGNDENQHLPVGSPDHDATTALEGGTHETHGAPISFSSSNSEFIQSITVSADTADATPGELGYLKGSVWTPLAEGTAVINGATYNVVEGENGFELTLVEGSKTTTSLTLYFKPDGDSSLDIDVPVKYEVTVANSAGSTATYNGTSTVVIDAVADLADDVTTTVNNGESALYVGSDDDDRLTLNTANHKDADGSVAAGRGADGFETDTYQNIYDGNYSFAMKVDTVFSDLDGSENHYILIEQPAGNWSLGDLPEGFTVDPSDATINVDGTTYFKVNVADSAINGDGTVSLEVDLNVTLTKHQGDVVEDIHTGTMTVETDTQGVELDGTNNTAIYINDATVTAEVELIQASLTVKTGWASEGSDDDKHTAGDHASPTYAGSTNDGAAPITIALGHLDTGTGKEFLSEITFDYDNTHGDLFYVVKDAKGNVIAEHIITPETPLIPQDYADESGNSKPYTLDFVYRPHEGDTDYSDVTIGYTVTVENAAGASTTFRGSSTVVVDAVADMATITTEGENSVNYFGEGEDGYSTAKPGDTVNVDGVKINFPDSSGGEDHTVVIDPPANVSVAGGTITVTDGEGNETTYTLTQTEGGFTCTDGTGKVLDVTVAEDGTVTIDAGDTSAKVELDLDFALSGDIATDSHDIKISGNVAVDDLASNGLEFDSTNNTASIDVTVTLTVDGTIDTIPTVQVGTGDSKTPDAYEAAAKDAHKGEYRPDGEALEDITATEGGPVSVGTIAGNPTAEFLAASSALITIGTEGGAAEGEFVSGYAFRFSASDTDFSAAETGQFMIGDVLIPMQDGEFNLVLADGTVLTVTTDLSDDGTSFTMNVVSAGETPLTDVPLHFVPGEGHSHEDVQFDTAVSVTIESNGYTKVFGSDDLEEGLQQALVDGNVVHTGEAGGDFFADSDYTAFADSDLVADIDAVAAQAEFDVCANGGNKIPAGIEGADDDANDGFFDKVVPGQQAFVTFSNLDLKGDTEAGDSTETHSVLIQAVKGFEPSAMYVTIDGVEHKVNMADLNFTLAKQTGDGGTVTTYHAVTLDNIAEALGVNEGDISGLRVGLNTPTGSHGSTDIKVGIHTSESTVAVRAEGDLEDVLANNVSFAEGKVTIEYANVQAPSINASGTVFENNTANAHLGDEEVQAQFVNINVGTGGAHDRVTDFSLALDSGSEKLGTLMLFESQEAFEAYQDAVAEHGGEPHFEGYEDYILNVDEAGKVDNSIDNGNVDGLFEGANGSFTGVIIYTPYSDSYSDAEPTFTGNISVINLETGATASDNAADVKIVTDAVAQQPEGFEVNEVLPEGVDTPDTTTQAGESRTVTASATFEDTDGSTEHFILVEAEAGWTMTYENAAGETVTLGKGDLEVFSVKGEDGSFETKTYYKIPATELNQNEAGEVQVDITMHAPTSAVYYNHDTAYNITVGAGSIEKADGGFGTEATFHNNTAVIIDGGISGSLERAHGPGTWVFEQTKPLFEDNVMDQHLADGGTEAKGEFAIGYTGAVTAEIIVPGDENGGFLTIGGQEAVQNADGQWVITLVLTGEGHRYEVAVTDSYADNATDLTIGGVKFIDGDGSEHTIPLSGWNNTVVIDAVADYTAIDAVATTTAQDNAEVYKAGDSLDAAEMKGDAVVSSTDGAGDSVAHFTVTATFSDNDGSESHFILVEMTPGWSPAAGGAGQVHIEGKAYYKIDVTGQEGPDFDIAMKFNGQAGGEYDATTGIYTNKLTVGTLVQDNSDVESTADNNVSVHINDSPVELQHSTVNTNVSIKLPDGDMLEGESFSVGIDYTAKMGDQLDSVKISLKGEGTLTLENGTEVHDGDVLTGDNLQNFIDHDATWNPDSAFTNTDVTITIQATITDTYSGQTVTLSTTKVVDYDAVADGGGADIESSNVDGDHAAVLSGANAVITVATHFSDFENSTEEHFAVLRQEVNNDYMLESVTVVTADGQEINVPLDQLEVRFDANNNPYYAVNLSKVAADNGLDEGNVTVKFEVNTPDVTSDTVFNTQAGTLSVDTIKHSSGNHELDYTNNWNMEVGNVTIQTGVVSDAVITQTHITDAVEATGVEPIALSIVQTAGASDSLTVTFELPDASEGTLMYDGVALTADAATIANFDSSLLTFVPTEYYSGEVALNYSVVVTDTKSGDTSEPIEQTLNISIEAVATEATDVSLDTTTLEGGGAIYNGEEITFTVNATFPDSDGSEEHFVLVEAQPGWEGAYDKVVLGADGNYQPAPAGATEGVFFKVPVGDDYDPAEGVTVTLTAPDTLVTDDSFDLDVKVVTFEPNAADNAQTVEVGAGNVTGSFDVVNATDIASDNAVATMEEQAVSLDLALVTTGAEESVTTITISLPEGAGTITYNGEAVTANADGSFTISPESGAVDTSAIGFVPAENLSGEVAMTYTATVENVNGDVRELGGDLTTVTVTGVVDEGEITGVTPPADVAPGAEVSFSLDVSFPDDDGSEQHYVLVKAPEGWTVENGGEPITEGEFAGYVPISVAQGQTSVTPVLTAPADVDTDASVDMQVVACSVENGVPAYSDPTTVTVNIDVVDASGTTPVLAESYTEDVSFALPVTLTGEAEGEVVTSVSVELPAGTVVTYGDTSFTSDGVNPVVITGANIALAGVTITPPTEFDGEMPITGKVTVQNTVGDVKELTFETAVTLDAVVSAPTLSVDSAFNDAGSVLTMTLSATFDEDSTSDVFLVKAVEGLDPVDTSLVANADGYYEVPAGADGQPVEISFTANADYAGDPVDVQAVSFDGATPVFSDAESVTDTSFAITQTLGEDGVTTIVGNDGDNTLTGTDGNDLLFGGLGGDTMDGGGGSDTFAWNSDSADSQFGDVITNFTVGSGEGGDGDKLDLGNLFNFGTVDETISDGEGVSLGEDGMFNLTLTDSAGNTLDAVLGGESASLTISNEAGEVQQQITVDFASVQTYENDDAARAVLESMIKVSSGGEG